MQDRYNLDVATPDEVPAILANVANEYYETQCNLKNAWQSKNAGIIWGDFATILDRAAAQCRKALVKRGF